MINLAKKSAAVVQSQEALTELLDARVMAFKCHMETPIDVCIAFLDAMDQPQVLSSYKHFPSECRDIWRFISAKGAALESRTFLVLLILTGMKRTVESNRWSSLPIRVLVGQLKYFHWMASEITGTEEWLDLDSDTFQKEIGAAMLHLYVCGSQMVEYRSGLPRKLLLTDGLRKSISNALYFTRIGGFKPFFQIHMHVHLRSHFNYIGRKECYHCCAELYAIHPEILGMFGGSWFYDPCVRIISPHLSYLQDEPISGGARLFRWGPTEDCGHDALLTSATRRNLAERGLYAPSSYFLVWDRESQLMWSAKVE